MDQQGSLFSINLFQ